MGTREEALSRVKTALLSQSNPSTSRSITPTLHGLVRLLYLLTAMSCGGAGAQLDDPRAQRTAVVKKDHGLRGPHPPLDPEEANLLDEIANTKVGEKLKLALYPPRHAKLVMNSGFTLDANGVFTRAAHLDEKIRDMKHFKSNALQGVDCIAILSIHRRKENENYIFPTLRNILGLFPRDTELNVLVGNDDDDYLNEETVAKELGSDAARLHIHRTRSGDSAFLERHMDIIHRAAWNYARALRSYTGTQGMLVLEDDIIWSREAISLLNQWLGGQHPEFISLYTRKSYLRLVDPAWRSIVSMPMRRHSPRFECTQASFFGPNMAQAVGHHLIANLTDTSYDWNMSRFFIDHQLTIGYAYPSIVQHIGKKSSGLGTFHQSDCFLP